MNRNCHSDHLFEYLTLFGGIKSLCGDAIDTNIVATVDRNTNDAKVAVNGKLQDIYRIQARAAIIMM